MTQKQKNWHKIGIVFLVLSLLCAGVYAWLGYEEARLEMPEIPEGADPLGAFGAAAALGAMAWFCVMGSMFAALLGAILSLGTTLLCAKLPWKIAGGAGIALHVGLLIAFFVRYSEFLDALFSF